jgi:hypothetical protein
MTCGGLLLLFHEKFPTFASILLYKMRLYLPQSALKYFAKFTKQVIVSFVKILCGLCGYCYYGDSQPSSALCGCYEDIIL